MPNAWNRFDHLMDIFYHSINYTSKGIIDAACYGAFERKGAEETRQLIEKTSKKQLQSSIRNFKEQQQTKRKWGDRVE